MSSLAFASLLTVVALAYTAFVLLVEMPEYRQEFLPKATVKSFVLDANIFQACSVTFFAYAC